MATTKKPVQAKQLTFEYEDAKYTAEFNRESVMAMEQAGFSIWEASKTPLASIMKLVAGAFQMHHPGMSDEEAMAIAADDGDMEGLFTDLSTMYADTLNSLFSGTGKKVKRGKNW